MQNISVGERVKQLREHFGLKQGEFSDEIGMSQTHVSRIEKGKLEPSNSFLNALKERFGINPEWMMTGEGEMLISPEGYIAAGIKKLGVQKFSEGLIKVLKDPEFVELQSLIAVGEMVKGSLDSDLEAYLRYILNTWNQGDERERIWLMVQLGKTFQEVAKRADKE